MARAIDAEKTKACIQNVVEHLAEAGNKAMAVALSFAIEIIDEQPTIEPKQEWISVKDRLPEIDQKVLVYDAGDETEIHVYHLREDLDGLYWDDEGGWAVDFENVTHWMPLPEPPKEGE